MMQSWIAKADVGIAFYFDWGHMGTPNVSIIHPNMEMHRNKTCVERKKCRDCQRHYFDRDPPKNLQQGKPGIGGDLSHSAGVKLAPCASSQLLPRWTWMPQALGWEWLAPEQQSIRPGRIFQVTSPRLR